MEKGVRTPTSNVRMCPWGHKQVRSKASKSFHRLPISHARSIARFRNVPTFGRDSIRRFANNVSELKKLGARDYENLLQVTL